MMDTLRFSEETSKRLQNIAGQTVSFEKAAEKAEKNTALAMTLVVVAVLTLGGFLMFRVVQVKKLFPDDPAEGSGATGGDGGDGGSGGASPKAKAEGKAKAKAKAGT